MVDTFSKTKFSKKTLGKHLNPIETADRVLKVCEVRRLEKQNAVISSIPVFESSGISPVKGSKDE